MENTSRRTPVQSADQAYEVLWTFQSLEDHPHGSSWDFVKWFLLLSAILLCLSGIDDHVDGTKGSVEVKADTGNQ